MSLYSLVIIQEISLQLGASPVVPLSLAVYIKCTIHLMGAGRRLYIFRNSPHL
jgi:hypothetical protein